MDSGIVKLHGKEYQTVALRVKRFREEHPDWSIITTLVENPGPIIIMKAEIADDKGRVISTGYAEESRENKGINRTSALENCETSAVGRALAFFGLAGSEIASADEIAAATGGKVKGQRAVPMKDFQTVILNSFIPKLHEAGEQEAASQVRAGLAKWGHDEAASWIKAIKEAHPSW